MHEFYCPFPVLKSLGIARELGKAASITPIVAAIDDAIGGLPLQREGVPAKLFSFWSLSLYALVVIAADPISSVSFSRCRSSASC